MSIGYQGKYLAPEPEATVPQPREYPVLGRIFCIAMCLMFCLAGTAAAAGALYLAKTYPDATPILLSPPDAAQARLTAMLDAVCQGDYAQAGGYLLGNPSLGAEETPEDALGLLLWNSFLGSMDYALAGDCYTTQDGLAQDITFSYLDLTSVTANLKTQSQQLLEQRVSEAEDMSEIYDENHEYREDFVMDILDDTARAALERDAKTASVALTVHLKHQDGQWWVVADTALLDAISGGILF